MLTVTYNYVVTTHENHLELASRLAACCTFTYGEARTKAGRALPSLDVWFVAKPSGAWRVAEPGSWLDDDEDAIRYTIDPTKSEGEIGREIHRLLEAEAGIA